MQKGEQPLLKIATEEQSKASYVVAKTYTEKVLARMETATKSSSVRRIEREFESIK